MPSKLPMIVIGGRLARRLVAQPSVACVGGSWIAARATIARGDYAEVTRLAGEAAREVELARSDAAAAG